MKIQAINGYLSTHQPCLHLNDTEVTGAYLQSIGDLHSVMLTIWEKEYRSHDKELEFLMSMPIEFGVYEKNNHLMPIVKIGPDNDPYLYSLPFNPVDPQNQEAIDYWIESRMLVVCFVEGENEKHFRGFRVLGIPDETRDYLVEKWIRAVEQGAGYNLKFLNFVKSLNNVPIEEVWSQAKKFEPFEE